MTESMTMNVEDFLNYIKEAKSKATYKNYKNGLNKFVQWYGKDANTILEERFEDLKSTDISTRKRFVREIEKFHRHLKRLGHPQNTAVAYTEGIRQLFRFYDMDIKGLPSEVTRKVITTKDFVPTVQQYRDMYNSGTLLDRVLISMGLDLAWRIGDFISQKKDDLPSFEQETPIPYELLTEKEEVISKSFLSAQSVQLLRTYVKILPTDNPYLFPNGNGGTVTHEGINKRLKEVAKKAKVHVYKIRIVRFEIVTENAQMCSLWWSIVMMKEIKEIKCGNCGTKITEEQMNLVEMDVKAKRKDFPITRTTLECRKCKNKIKYHHYPDPKDMTDKELINVYRDMEALMDSDAIYELNNFYSYYKGCIIAELERRGIDESRYDR